MRRRDARHRTTGYRPQNPEHRAIIEALVERFGEPLNRMTNGWKYTGDGPFAHRGGARQCFWCGRTTGAGLADEDAHWPDCAVVS